MTIEITRIEGSDKIRVMTGRGPNSVILRVDKVVADGCHLQLYNNTTVAGSPFERYAGQISFWRE